MSDTASADARTGPPRDTGRPSLLILGPLVLRRGWTPVPVGSALAAPRSERSAPTGCS
ncbi:hypothetical protein ACFCZR_07675 [Streptomyces rubiginosohelvolus]|uniref:hypothetical protein n=1 Tax=Streptomyces rubiginosohelvolus TaxID=67362 RepID=UPI0035D91A88